MQKPINHVLFAVIAALIFQSGIANVNGQEVGQDIRSNPAPWRPSFGSMSQSASQSGTQSNEPDPTLAPVQSQSVDRRSNSNPNSAVTGNNSDQFLEPGQSPRVAMSVPITKVQRTMDVLPNSAGQVWREYDISPYTSRISNAPNSQQAILDWILRETGTEMWFNEPMGILNADKNHVYVYHTPEIQRVIARVVDRFVKTQGQIQTIDVNLVTVDNPNWRSNVYGMLQPIEVQSPGVEAWLISKESAARLLSQISRRGDFKQHSSGRLTGHDGQNLILEKTQPRQFVRNLRWVANQYPAYQPLMTTIDEGYKLSISSLSSLDNAVIEATLKCDVDLVEKLTSVKVDVPSSIPGRTEQMDLQIPQLVSWRLHERFRWPNDQVLLLSCGVVAKPEPQDNRGPMQLFANNRNRADALLFVEYRGPASGQGTFTSFPTALTSTQETPQEAVSLAPNGFRQANLPKDDTLR